MTVQALAKHGGDAWLQAAQSIPRNIRTIYMHAVQSYVWNVVASARLRAFGKRVIAGDLVCSARVWPDGGDSEAPFNPDACSTCKDAPVAGDSAHGGGERKSKDQKCFASDVAGNATEHNARARMENVSVVKQDDVTKGRYTIEDVVLPLPGSDIKYPEWPTCTSPFPGDPRPSSLSES
jgi:tRNA pseudouridine13 synthase